jgi:hypothetical protein
VATYALLTPFFISLTNWAVFELRVDGAASVATAISEAATTTTSDTDDTSNRLFIDGTRKPSPIPSGSR